MYAPGAVFTDLAAAVADGAHCPPAPGKPAQPGRHGAVKHTPNPKSLSLSDFHDPTPPNPAGTKNRG
ncbi:Mobile element protein [Mycobacterium marinum MB2]|nr:Mobile element protein [Mycobacterium marinum MB2]